MTFPTKTTTKRTHALSPPSINSLPTLPRQHRPALTLFGWGCGDTGQLGVGPMPEGSKDEWDKPKRNTLVEGMVKEGAFGTEGTGLVAIAAGGMHSLVVDENGTVWSFGINDEGALGRETTNVPNPLKPGEFVPSEDVEASPRPVQALVDEGFRAVKVAAGDNISAALDSEGGLRVWGSFRDSQGAVGFSTQSTRQFVPKLILISPRPPQSPEKFVSIAAGQDHLLALTACGNVYAFGNGEYGQLGRKVIARRKINGTVPEKVILGHRSRKAVVIGAGVHQSFAVDNEGVVWGWGLNTMGQIGVGRDSGSSPDAALVHTPMKVIGLSKEELGGAQIIEISGGDCFTLFLASDGKVYACGSSFDGRLGLAEMDKAFSNRQSEQFLPEPVLVTFPEPVPSSDPIIHLSSGSRNSLAITASGVMFSWGQHNQGGLGLGDCTEASTPTVVIRREGSWRAKAVACGGPHCLALLEKKT
ncbi:regulator of chromosome condensation 1/beta-lactamase-inhibitor protein II [Flammula alnicola]|nr:regulator of chromosome condensation 1/beta-lactamase-inhibitor protein II [Flammula alnicola]